MPTYEYKCEDCGHIWEADQRITAEPLKDCPKCQGSKAKRLISRTAFILSGGGWAADNYSSSN